MRYPEQHKPRTRERILRRAAPLFRRRGYGGVSVDELMKAAGLTRGAFYAHFDSKEALAAEVLARDAGLVRMMKDRPGPEPPDLNRQAMLVLADYLTPEHLAEVGRGCPLATMAGDAARGPARFRAAWGERFAALIRELQRGLGRTRRAESDAILAAVLAVGGVQVARACADPAQVERVESACREGIRRLLSAERRGRPDP